MCVRLIQNRMELFSTAAILFVWRLKLRPEIARSSRCWHWCTKSKIYFPLQIVGNCIRCWAFRWLRLSETTAISILCGKQAASFFFPIFRTQWKMYFFVPSVHPCMHHNYGVISGRHTSADCVWPIPLVAGLCTPWRTSVSSHQVQCNVRTFDGLLRKNVYLFLERWKKSNNTWLRALMQSDCLCSSFFEHYNPYLLCDWVPGRSS